MYFARAYYGAGRRWKQWLPVWHAVARAERAPLLYVFPEALVAGDPVGRGFGDGRETFFFAVDAGAAVEGAFAAQGHARAVAAGGAVVGLGERFAFVECMFLCDDAEVFAACGVGAGFCCFFCGFHVVCFVMRCGRVNVCVRYSVGMSAAIAGSVSVARRCVS